MVKKQTLTTKGLKPPKRHQAKTHAKIYWPYLPLIALLLGAAFLNIWQPLQSNKPATLAYATEMSRSNLLSSTNTQRVNNGSSPLTINSQLNAAAQAKANDMVARNYWSHNTPDGQEPWIFFDAQGYAYAKAGENLAYGFSTSNETVIGWMNSPSHRANLLDSAFTEVGFGFANSANFIGTGNQTIIVAHYGKPVVATASTPTPAPEPVPAPQPQTQQAQSTPARAPTPTEEVVIESNPDNPPETQENNEIEIVEDTVVNKESATNSDNPVVANEESKRISRIQELTGGIAPWSALLVSVAAFSLAVIWLIKHFVIVKRYIIEGEHFVAHHPILDLIVLVMIAIAVYLSQSSGVVL
jgi:uncharacterized protein YkwD